MKAVMLRVVRTERGVSQADLKAEIGLTANSLSDIELGRIDVTQGFYNQMVEAIHRIADRREPSGNQDEDTARVPAAASR